MGRAILVSVLTIATAAFAQSLRIHMKGTAAAVTYPLSGIDSITFLLEVEPGGTTASLPADVLDLQAWKLTLPIGKAGSPDEIVQPALATYSHDEYFHVNGNGTGVVFRAHCGGVTTSGSSYPRCELREMKGTGRAAWSTSSGTHTMEIRQAITHLPDVKAHVVAGQIHGASDDLIVIRLEGTKLFVDHNGADGPVLTNSYMPGTVFTVKFLVQDGRVKVYYNGSGTPVDDYAASESGCYFKAGCYTQSNVSKGDAASAYGEVVIHALSVSHR